MTPEEKAIQDMRRDLLFVLAHPEKMCMVCAYSDRDCEKTGCSPKWRGDKRSETWTNTMRKE